MTNEEARCVLIKEAVKQKLLAAGAVAVGVARAGRVEEKAAEEYAAWLEKGHEAGMDFMHNHREIREDVRLLLEGAASVICMAFSYSTEESRNPELPKISTYALLPDYHDRIRKRIREAGLEALLGDEHKDWRICVDSAPIMERYWAVKSGIAIRGENGAAIIPGTGCEVFLAEIITTRDLPADKQIERDCGHCGACRRACPTDALQSGGTTDCNSCLSYLTIEHRGEWTDARHKKAMSTPAGKQTMFGCDRCISACPHNRREEHRHDSPQPIEAIVELTKEDVLLLSPEELSSRLRGSCLKRAKHAGLVRNASNLSAV